MPDDPRIDPEFQPRQPGKGQARRLRLLGVLAVVVAAFTTGWLLRSPTDSGPAEEAVTASSTELAADTTAATTTTRPRTTTTTTVREVVELEVPLGDAVPGFTDTLIMLQWGEISACLGRHPPDEPSRVEPAGNGDRGPAGSLRFGGPASRPNDGQSLRNLVSLLVGAFPPSSARR